MFYFRENPKDFDQWIDNLASSPIFLRAVAKPLLMILRDCTTQIANILGIMIAGT